MIINRIGAQFYYDGTVYTIGGKVYANDCSEYEGLYGVITEIRDGDDRETENDVPDIYCEFMPPVLPDEIRAIEERFSQLYAEPREIDDLTLDMAIMAPDMLHVLEPLGPEKTLPIYVVREDWSFNGQYGEDIHFATSPEMAKYIFTELIQEELMTGYLKEWSERGDMEQECSGKSIEYWIHDEYLENHYKVYIEQQNIPVSSSMLSVIGQFFTESHFWNQFAEQIECWEELENMTVQQITQMIISPDVPARIQKQLKEDGYLQEAYWESVSEASFDLVKKFKEGLK